MLLILFNQCFWCCLISAFNIAFPVLLLLLFQCFYYCFPNVFTVVFSMFLLLLFQYFWYCLIITFTDLAAESFLHKNLDDFLTISWVDFWFQEQKSTRFVGFNFWIQFEFSSSKIGLESSRIETSIRFKSNIRFNAINLSFCDFRINYQINFRNFKVNLSIIKMKIKYFRASEIIRSIQLIIRNN